MLANFPAGSFQDCLKKRDDLVVFCPFICTSLESILFVLSPNIIRAPTRPLMDLLFASQRASADTLVLRYNPHPLKINLPRLASGSPSRLSLVNFIRPEWSNVIIILNDRLRGDSTKRSTFVVYMQKSHGIHPKCSPVFSPSCKRIFRCFYTP